MDYLFLDIFHPCLYNKIMQLYQDKTFHSTENVLEAEVPASKSLLNRVLILAAFGHGSTSILCGDFSDDTRAMLNCLTSLGVAWEKTAGGLIVHGCGNRIPNQTATLDVCSAGTAARFLSVALAFSGGDYTMLASEQMQKRPMEILAVLEQAGVSIDYLAQPGHFPFILHSKGISADEFSVDTNLSTQYASGVLLAAAVGHPLRLHLTGERTHGSYIAMTLRLIEQFGAKYTRDDDTISITPSEHSPELMEIEADLSGACYFYALSLLFHMRVCIPHVHMDTLQGDLRLLHLLQEKGVRLSDTPKGLLADGSSVTAYSGFEVSMRDFSDQALTIAALAPFATSETHITGIGHIRKQECDRIHAIVYNLRKLGIKAIEEEDGVRISPGEPLPATIECFDDHRVAMAFSLIGLKTGTLQIENPLCCRKTFSNYFEILDSITQ